MQPLHGGAGGRSCYFSNKLPRLHAAWPLPAWTRLAPAALPTAGRMPGAQGPSPMPVLATSVHVVRWRTCNAPGAISAASRGARSVAWRDALRRGRTSANGGPQSRPRRSVALHREACASILPLV